MYPEFDEFLTRLLHGGSFALSDFIFVMREHQILTTQMKVETCSLAQVSTFIWVVRIWCSRITKIKSPRAKVLPCRNRVRNSSSIGCMALTCW